MQVSLDGIPLRGCDEAMAGKDGWAIVCNDDETGRIHYCACGSWNICRRVERGWVSAESVLDALGERPFGWPLPGEL
jgi:hypothetical protein